MDKGFFHIATANEIEKSLETPGSSDTLKTLDVASGPFTDNYEQFVHKIFSPAEDAKNSAKALAEYTDMTTNFSPGNPLPDIPLSILARMDVMEEGQSETGKRIFSPLEMMYTYYNQFGMEDQPYAKFPVYQPKTSSEYHSIKNKTPRVGETPSMYYKVAKTASSPNIWTSPAPYEKSVFNISNESRRTIIPNKPHYMMLDYKDTKDNRAPVSQFLYQRDSDLRRSDSRIVGSNFVMLNLRQDDPWKDRVDKLLTQARNC